MGLTCLHLDRQPHPLLPDELDHRRLGDNLNVHLTRLSNFTPKDHRLSKEITEWQDQLRTFPLVSLKVPKVRVDFVALGNHMTTIWIDSTRAWSRTKPTYPSL